MLSLITGGSITQHLEHAKQSTYRDPSRAKVVADTDRTVRESHWASALRALIGPVRHQSQPPRSNKQVLENYVGDPRLVQN